MDSIGTLLTLLPPAMAVLALFAPLSLSRLIAVAPGLSLTALGGVLCALAIAFAAGLFFWGGAVPVLAADIEVDRRPPSGNFALLGARGFERVLRAGAVAWALPLLLAIVSVLVFGLALPLALLRRSPALLTGAALAGAAALVGSVVLDALARLVIVRAAAFGEEVSVAFGKAISLLGARLGASLLVSLAYLVLELIAASAAGLFAGVISSSSLLDPRLELLALAPRAAVSLAFGAVFAWLEVGKMGSYAALALDAEGLVPEEQESPPRPGPVLLADTVVEALPAEDEPT